MGKLKNNLSKMPKEEKKKMIIGIIVVVLLLAIIVAIVVIGKNKLPEPPKGVTFQEKYTITEFRLENSITTTEEYQGFKTELDGYSAMIKDSAKMSVDDKEKFIEFTRNIDNKYKSSKARAIAYHGLVKKQYNEDLANNIFTETTKAHIEALFVEYDSLYKEGKYKEAFGKVESVSNELSVGITEDGVKHERTPQEKAAIEEKKAAEAKAEMLANVRGTAYHTDAKYNEEVSDPNNGNKGRVVENGTEVYDQGNGATYTYITKEQFIEMMTRNGTSEEMARMMAELLPARDGLVPIGAEEDGRYE